MSLEFLAIFQNSSWNFGLLILKNINAKRVWNKQ